MRLLTGDALRHAAKFAGSARHDDDNCPTCRIVRSEQRAHEVMRERTSVVIADQLKIERGRMP